MQFPFTKTQMMSKKRIMTKCCVNTKIMVGPQMKNATFFNPFRILLLWSENPPSLNQGKELLLTVLCDGLVNNARC
jgi:hypothetical protein